MDNQKIFALSGDYGYINPIATTIKSVLYHNPNSKIYIVNSDIPQEWFRAFNYQLRNSDDEVIDIKIEESYLDQEHVGLNHIHPIAYGKILLPDLLSEDRVVYLDSDLIINDDLSSLFSLDLQGHPIACAPDIDENNGNFNTGVIVYDLKKARNIPNLVHDELQLGQNHELRNADQDVMNTFFGDDYLQLPLEYNYQIGMDGVAFYSHHDYYFQIMNSIHHPKIIHYLTPDKPWKTVSTSRLRQLWWQYFTLSLTEIIQHQPLPQIYPSFKGKFFIFLTTQNMGQLPQLIQKMPEYQFNIAAWTMMGEPVLKLLAAPNVRLFPVVTGPQLDYLIENCDAYLDINKDGKERKVIDPFEQKQKPIFTFADVADNVHGYAKYYTFAPDQLSAMVQRLKQL